MRFHWLLPSFFFSIFLLSSPAEAARLQSWRFDTNQNRLYITTDTGVQPRAQLIGNPTRVVIDLPGTSLGRPPVSQLVGGAIQAVRVGQFNNQTTRVVIELSPGYTVDPQQVIVRGSSASQWTVQLPTPQRIGGGSGSPGNSSQGRLPDAAGAQTVLENVRVTPDGLFVRTSGRTPEVQVRQSSDRSLVNVDLQGTTLSREMQGFQLAVNRNGIGNVQVSQLQSSPPVARVTLNVTDGSENWQATVSGLGGVIILPGAGGDSAVRQPQPTMGDRDRAFTTVESVEMSPNGTQLLIRTDGPFTYTSGWDRNSGLFQITIPSARLASNVKSPQSGSLGVQLQQADSQTVVVWLQPASGVTLTELNQPSSTLLTLQLQRSPGVSGPRPSSDEPRDDKPRFPNGRVVVAVDAGHGGRDTGAIGIRGLREKDVVLDISTQVAQLLEQQGVQAVLTRTNDREIDLEPRVQYAERVNASLFVSIHANAINMSRPDVNGIETYYYDSGYQLARTIHNSILQATGARDRRVRQARFYVLRKTSMPAVLVETGFVTGAEDARRLADPSYRRVMAEAIARGILQYIKRYR